MLSSVPSKFFDFFSIYLPFPLSFYLTLLVYILSSISPATFVFLFRNFLLLLSAFPYIFRLFFLLPLFPASFHSYLTVLKMSPATDGSTCFGCVILADKSYITIPSPTTLSSSRGILGAFAKLRTATTSFFICLTFCPQGTTRFRLDGFSLNLIFEDFSKIC